MELKDKLGAVSELSEAVETAVSGSGKTEAINGLISLGYSKSEAVSALANVSEDDLTTEEYIKRALKGIGR